MNGALHKFNPTGLAAPAGLYSHVVGIPAGARLLHVAGQIGITPEGAMRAGARAQIEQAFENLKTALAGGGMEPADLVNVNSYFVDEADIASFREIRIRYLPTPPPASTLLVVKALASPDWLFELDALAARLD